jgi:hypothetical protein
MRREVVMFKKSSLAFICLGSTIQIWKRWKRSDCAPSGLGIIFIMIAYASVHNGTASLEVVSIQWQGIYDCQVDEFRKLLILNDKPHHKKLILDPALIVASV